VVALVEEEIERALHGGEPRVEIRVVEIEEPLRFRERMLAA